MIKEHKLKFVQKEYLNKTGSKIKTNKIFINWPKHKNKIRKFIDDFF